MASLNGFNAAEVEPNAPREELPEGTYLAAIVESQMKITKKKDGQRLELTFEVLDGTHKGRRVWANLNLDNPSETSVEIAKRDLSAICRAVGVMTPKDSADLHGKPLMIVVKHKPDDNGDPRAEVKGYRAAATAPAARTPAKAAPAAAAPWKR